MSNKISINKQFKLNSKNKNRLAIFASYSNDGRISDTVIYYLKGLLEVVDNIIFIADNLIFSEEIEKIKDLVCYASFDRHQEYDFGSYKKGFFYAKDNFLLENVEEIILCNDSCYGPIYPFSFVFDEMKNKNCDFWGLTSNIDFKKHIQSFFYVFKRNVFLSQSFFDFISKIKRENSVQDVILNYEVEWTEYLESKGFKSEVFLKNYPEHFEISNITVYPIYCINNNIPIIKKKAITLDGNFVNKDGIYNTFFKIKNINKELFYFIYMEYEKRMRPLLIERRKNLLFFIFYYILSKITFGKKRKEYKQKRKFYKSNLCEFNEFYEIKFLVK